MPLVPLELLAAIAVHVEAATGIRAVARRAPTSWREADDPYVVVSQVSDAAPDLRGDGTTLADAMVAQASLFETAGDTDDARLEALIVALDGVEVAGYGRGIVRGWRLVPEPDSDDVTHALDVAYRAAR